MYASILSDICINDSCLTWFQLLLQLVIISLSVLHLLFLLILLLIFGALFVDPVAREQASGIVGVTEGPYDVCDEGLLQLGQLGGAAVHEGANR